MLKRYLFLLTLIISVTMVIFAQQPKTLEIASGTTWFGYKLLGMSAKNDRLLQTEIKKEYVFTLTFIDASHATMHLPNLFDSTAIDQDIEFQTANNGKTMIYVVPGSRGAETRWLVFEKVSDTTFFAQAFNQSTARTETEFLVLLRSTSGSVVP